MRSLIFSFLALIVLSAAFMAVGVIIAFRPATYSRWIRWSKAESYAPWLVHEWGVNHERYGWRVRIVGIAMSLFGFTALILTVWICWFQ
jgi:hypothetical protein